MLGRFLEYSVAAPDIPASLDFYRRLGFSQATVGDTWPHPYAVVTDGRLCIGLHKAELDTPILTFVKPDLLKFVGEAERAGLPIDYRRLGNHVFNEIGLLDTQKNAIRLIEARTFSPGDRKASEFSACGYFEEVALPSSDTERAKAFWEQCGFIGIEELDAALPHISCTSDTLDVGLYEAESLPLVTLMFANSNLPRVLETANAAGVEPSRKIPPALPRDRAALFIAPEGTRLLVTAD